MRQFIIPPLAREPLGAGRASGKFDTVELNNPRRAIRWNSTIGRELSVKLCERERSSFRKSKAQGITRSGEDGSRGNAIQEFSDIA